MSKEQLFIRHHKPLIGNIISGNELEVSPLSLYTLKELPADCRQLSEGAIDYSVVSDRHDAVLNKISPLINDNQDPDIAKVIQLDLLFMFGAYIPARKEMYNVAPDSLKTLIQQQCERFPELPNFMTYDLIIDLNASEYLRTGNMRVYSDGEDGLNERDFYLGHHVSEPFATKAARELRMLVESPEQHDTAVVLDEALNNMLTFGAYMRHYRNLSTGSFEYFRQFLDTYADGTRNASGAFMPSVQLLELTLKSPSEEQIKFIDSSMKYFPLWSQSEIRTWKDDAIQGRNIEDSLKNDSLSFDEKNFATFGKIIEEFRVIRMSHRKTAKRNIPQAFPEAQGKYDTDAPRNNDGEQDIFYGESDEIKGTAGFNVPHVLGNSILRLIKLRERLNKLNL